MVDLCTAIGAPPYDESDIDAISARFAAWLLTVDRKIDELCR
jgi:hypothetical protein